MRQVMRVIKAETDITGTLDDIKAKAPFMANSWHGETDIALTDMCGLNPLKYHPGAVAAWEEAGYSIPDCAK